MTVAERTRIVGVSLIVPVVLIVLWWVLSADSTSAFYPSLSSILTSFKDTWLFSRVGSDVVPSLIRFGLGYLLAVFLGIFFGVLFGRPAAAGPRVPADRAVRTRRSPRRAWCRSPSR